MYVSRNNTNFLAINVHVTDVRGKNPKHSGCELFIITSRKANPTSLMIGARFELWSCGILGVNFGLTSRLNSSEVLRQLRHPTAIIKHAWRGRSVRKTVGLLSPTESSIFHRANLVLRAFRCQQARSASASDLLTQLTNSSSSLPIMHIPQSWVMS